MLLSATMCLALNVYHEARGEPIEGQLAVAMVTLNRARVAEVGVCEVVLARKQFSWTILGVKDRPMRIRTGWFPKEEAAWERAKMVAQEAPKMRDFTMGATFYHAKTETVNPTWSYGMERKGTWGEHHFYCPGKKVLALTGTKKMFAGQRRYKETWEKSRT